MQREKDRTVYRQLSRQQN